MTKNQNNHLKEAQETARENTQQNEIRKTMHEQNEIINKEINSIFQTTEFLELKNTIIK